MQCQENRDVHTQNVQSLGKKTKRSGEVLLSSSVKVCFFSCACCVCLCVCVWMCISEVKYVILNVGTGDSKL